MSEYIERKAVINKINEIPAYFDSGDIKYGIELAIQAIKDTPAADVVEVVRCKDCKRWFAKRTKRNKQLIGYCMRMDGNEYRVNADDFCSYGERKDEE